MPPNEVPALNTAEAAFFESGGETVDPKLSEGLPPVEKPVDAPVVADAPTDDKPVDDKPTPADIAKANKEAQAARTKLLTELGAVPQEALHEARQETKTLKQQQAELLAWKQQVEPLITQLKPQQTGNPYDPQQNPNEYSAWEWQTLQNEVKSLKEGRQQDAQFRAAQERTQQILGWGQAQEREFIKTQPDYAEASNFAREARKKQLAVFNPDPAWIEATINNEIAGIIQMAAQSTVNGIPMNPAQKAYEFAIANGYKPKDETDNDSVAAAQKIAAAQKASGGLKGGASPKGKVSLDELSNIDTSTKAGKKKFDEMWAQAMS